MVNMNAALPEDFIPTGDFFKLMDTDWERAAQCTHQLLLRDCANLLSHRLLPPDGLTVAERYEDIPFFNALVGDPIKDRLKRFLKDGSFVVVGGTFVRGDYNDADTFGIALVISHHAANGVQLRSFEAFLNMQDRRKWLISGIPDADDRSINDPAYLLSSKATKMQGSPFLPIGMRLDMMGQYCVENGWSAYQVLGQQLLLTVKLVIKKGQ